MSQSQFTRGKQIDRAQVMNDLIKSRKITSEGADWLTLRMDPYHDFRRPIAGYPDADNLDTIVSVRNYEYNISQPAALGANWDCHIFTLPLDSTSFDLGTNTNGQFVQTAETYNMGLVNIAKDAAGGPLFPTAVPVASGNFSMVNMDSFTDLQTGLSRIIGFGLEVIDTSAELYKQGAITCYSMPATESCMGSVSYLNTATTHQAQVPARLLVAPPSTVGEAILFRSSTQWEAKDGCYMSIGQIGVNNPFCQARRELLHVSDDTTMTGGSVALCGRLTANTALQAAPLMTSSSPQGISKTFNITQSGVFLSGLSSNATFKVRVRVYLEQAPLVTDTALIPLASPSAPYDVKALELYSLLVTEMPVAVPVCFNAKGDWWRWILRTVGKLAPVLGPVFGPIGGQIGGAIGAAVTPISKMADDAEARRKARKANQSNGKVKFSNRK
jgi:hypothetical protein